MYFYSDYYLPSRPLDSHGRHGWIPGRVTRKHAHHTHHTYHTHHTHHRSWQWLYMIVGIETAKVLRTSGTDPISYLVQYHHHHHPIAHRHEATLHHASLSTDGKKYVSLLGVGLPAGPGRAGPGGLWRTDGTDIAPDPGHRHTPQQQERYARGFTRSTHPEPLSCVRTRVLVHFGRKDS